jgi:hypothetical protein
MIAPWPTERGGTGSAFSVGGEAWIIPVIHEVSFMPAWGRCRRGRRYKIVNNSSYPWYSARVVRPAPAGECG